jgi:[ribosomal protein S5]-alanine N-acetyltransferase
MHLFTLATDRLVLLPFEQHDVDDVLAYAGTKTFGRYVPALPFPYEREHAEAFVTLAIEPDWTRDPHLAIVLDGSVIGAVSLALDEAETAALGYAIGRTWWGQGFGTQVACAAIEAAFSRTTSRWCGRQPTPGTWHPVGP